MGEENGKDDKEDLVGAYPACGACGSRAVVRDAWAEWDFCAGEWRLKATFDHYACDSCGGDIVPKWQVDKAFRRLRIRRLNDALRRGDATNASIVLTQGVQALGDDVLPKVFEAIAEFSGFSEDNDPYGEHDFGSIELAEQKIFWKVDYYDNALKYLSPDPASPVHTHRVLTIMLASEY